MLLEKLIKKYGGEVAHWSALRDGGEADMRSLLDGLDIVNAMEIGTHHGLTALVLAEYANRVLTIDVKEYKIYETADNIEYRVCPESEKISRYKSMTGFFRRDLVFIDGDHRPHGVLDDWELVKDDFKYILFHDYNGPHSAGTKAIVDNLDKDEWKMKVAGLFCLLERRS